MTTPIADALAGRIEALSATPADPPPERVDDVESDWQRIAPHRFRHARVDQLDGATGQAVAQWRRQPGRNLLLLGAVGVGKTHAALACARLAVEARMAVRFWPVVELLDALRPGRPNADDTLDRAARVPLLILDDLGGERPTDWTGERLYLLVNRRWLEQRPIIATSNLAAENGAGPLVDTIGLRTYDRLTDGAVTLRMGGRSRRRQRPGGSS